MVFARLIELHRKDGVKEVLRGVRDWMQNWGVETVKAGLYSKKTLTVEDISVDFTIEGAESVRRAEGHGELDVLSDFVSKVSTEDVVWDVGANQGTYALFASEIGAETYAFEPNNRLCEIIRENAEQNRVEISVRNVALGSKEGKMVLRRAGHAGGRWIADEGNGDEVMVKRGDCIDAAHPTIVKIDVEGHELDVLGGLSSTIRNCRICYVECHTDREEVRSKLHKLGFDTRFLTNDIVKGEIKR